MIKKFKQFNESLLDKLKGPSKEEVEDKFRTKFLANKMSFHELNKVSKKNDLKRPNLLDKLYSIGYKDDFNFKTPEEFIQYIIDNIKINDRYNNPDEIFWEKDKNQVIIAQDLKTKRVWVSFLKIWYPIKIVFDMKDNDLNRLINNILNKDERFKGFKTYTERGTSIWNLDYYEEL
jgi:hypothetical protein